MGDRSWRGTEWLLFGLSMVASSYHLRSIRIVKLSDIAEEPSPLSSLTLLDAEPRMINEDECY
jgi:hypothetical protein